MIFPTLRLLRQAYRIVQQQQQQIVRLQKEVAVAELAYMRIGRDMLEQFLIALDTPENNDAYRERLSESLGFYRDEISVREEHV